MFVEKLKRVKTPVLALVSGALLPFAFAPYNVPVMAIVSLLLLLIVIRKLPAKQAAVAGYLFGWGYFGHGVYWVYFSIHHFGHAPLWLAIIIMLGMVAILATYIAVLAYLLNRFFGEDSVIRYLLAFPGVWLGLEALRGVLFTGFPWLSLGYSQIDTGLAGWVPIVGVLGVSWIVVLITGGVACALFCSKKETKIRAVVLALSLWVMGWGLTAMTWVEPAGNAFNVALLQGNVPQEIKWLRSFQRINNKMYLEMTKEQAGADLVIWPETSIPAFYHGIQESLMKDLREEATTHQTDIVVGLPVMLDGASGYYNGLHSVKYPDEFYLKRHLVPLGEYLPLKPFSTFILDFLQIPLSDFSAGEKVQPLLQGGGYPFASSICYEDVFQQSSIDGLPDAAYLVNVSNDTWFGDTIAPYQHFQMARMRALESGRYMLRSTNTGLTAIINQQGKVIKQAPMFKRVALKGEVIPFQGVTPFVQGGWWVVLLFAILLPLASFLKRDR